MNPGKAVAIAGVLALAAPSRAGKVTLVVGDEKARRASAAAASPDVRVLVFDRALLADPIAKGRFLASVQSGGLVLSAARGRACGWLSEELDGARVVCIPPFNGAQVLDYAREARWSKVAALYAPGFERVFARLRGDGRARGVELAPVLVRRLSDLPAVLPPALVGADALWLLDGTLAEGPGRAYVVAQSLSRRVPLISADAALAGHGAFLTAELEDDALLRHALSLAGAAASGQEPGPADPPPGRLLVNEVLARRWGLRVPGGPR